MRSNTKATIFVVAVMNKFVQSVFAHVRSSVAVAIE